MRSTTTGPLAHLRRNAVAYLALFVGLGGTGAYAAEVLPDGSVGTRQLKDEAVTPAKLRPSTVGTRHLRDEAVTAAKLRPGSVGTGRVLNDSLRGVDIADGTITEADVTDGSLEADDLAPGTLPDLSAYYDKQAADDRFMRGRTLRSGFRIIHNGAAKGELLDIPHHGSLTATCERQAEDRGTVYWEPTTESGSTSQIWMEDGNGVLSTFERNYTEPPASMRLDHDDRATVEVAGPTGLTSLVVISKLSDHLIGGGYCEFFVFGSHGGFFG